MSTRSSLRLAVAACVASLCLCACATPAGIMEQIPRLSVDSGVYTQAQAARGERRFDQACASCHRRREITRGWFLTTNHVTMGDLLESIMQTMPEGNPGSLPTASYVDILAFILRSRGHPAGEEELPTEIPALRRIGFAL